MASSWDGAGCLLLLLLLLLLPPPPPCSAVSGMPGDLDAAGPHDLLCWKESCQARLVTCSWKAGDATKAKYTLNLRYQDKSLNKTFQVGEGTSFSFDETTVSVLNNVTIWVENHAGGRMLASEKLMLQISQAVKFDAPAREKFDTSRANGILTLKWSEQTRDCPTLKKEVRIRSSQDAPWTLGNCRDPEKEEDDGTSGKLVVLCRVDKNIPHEVQIRYRTSHWSSHWSAWSESIHVPVEIQESPKVTYTVGQLGSNGLRNVTLEWEKPSREQGEVVYALTFVLLPCHCTEEVETFSVDNRTSYQIALCGAAYNISLRASNQVGRAQPYASQLPPAGQASGLSFRHSRLSGTYLDVQWEAKTHVQDYCFEAQPLDEALQRKPCAEDATPAYGDITENSATLEPNRCYRVAVHTLDSETQVWSTSAFSHFFSRNTSFEDPIQVHVTSETTDSAILRWKPPQVLLACPDTLKKYIICCRNEQTGNVSYYEADASGTNYTVLGLQPKTAYRVGVGASMGEEESACRPRLAFLTDAPDPKSVTLALSFWILGIFGGLLLLTSIFWFGKKRAKKVLCSALPDPANTEAVKITPITEAAQVPRKLRFIDPLESSSPTEPFLVELPPQEEHSANAKEDLLGAARAVEECPPPKEDQTGSATLSPLEYNSQGLLSPTEDDERGQEGWGDFTGVPSDVRAGCSLLPPQEVKAGGCTAPPRAPAPLSLTLLETVVVSRSSSSAGGGGFRSPT